MTALLLTTSVALLVIAALHDAAVRTIPNMLAAILALCGIALRVVDGHLAAALEIGLLVFCFALLCWRLRLMGGGDVKLLAAGALVVAPWDIPAMIMSIALAGGVLTIPYLLGRRVRLTAVPQPDRLLARIIRVERRRLCRGGPLPYAVAIAAGTVLTIAQGSVS